MSDDGLSDEERNRELRKALTQTLTRILEGDSHEERRKLAIKEISSTKGKLRHAIKNATFALRYSPSTRGVIEEAGKYQSPPDDVDWARENPALFNDGSKLKNHAAPKITDEEDSSFTIRIQKPYTLIAPRYCPLCTASLDWAVDRNSAMCGQCRVYVGSYVTQEPPDEDRPEHEEALKAGPGDMMGLVYVVCFLLPYLLTGRQEAQLIPEYAVPFWAAYNGFPDRPEDAESHRRAKRVWEMRLGKKREVVR